VGKDRAREIGQHKSSGSTVSPGVCGKEGILVSARVCRAYNKHEVLTDRMGMDTTRVTTKGQITIPTESGSRWASKPETCSPLLGRRTVVV